MDKQSPQDEEPEEGPKPLNYNEWFIREVEKGIAAADRGELVEHEDVRKFIDTDILANANPLDRIRATYRPYV